MVETYFIWSFEEYDWNGRTEYKKVVYLKNVRRRQALDFCKENSGYHMDRMENLDHSFEK